MREPESRESQCRWDAESERNARDPRTQRSRTPARHAMGRVFNRIVQDLAVGGIEDTQCGLKLFRADAARDIFTRQRINGFGFDVEVLYLARKLGYGIACVPIHWEHRENSRVRPVRDAMAMLKDVLAVKWYAARKLYHMPECAPRAPE